MLGNEHKLSWVSKHVGAKSNRPLLAALLIAVFFVLTRRRPDEDEGSGVVDTARDVRKVAEMVRRSKDSSRLLVGSYLSYQSALPYNRPTTQPRTHSPAHPLTRSPAHPLTRSTTHPLTRLSSSSFSSFRTRRPPQRGKRWQTNNARFCFRARSTQTRRIPWRIPSPRSRRRTLSGA